MNGWRAELGRVALSWSGSLEGGACAWATHLAELGAGGSHQPGPYGEVIYGNGGGCGGAFSFWKNSGAHYNGLVGETLTVGAIVSVSDSYGKCWAVGRLQ